ncbi:transposase [Burkholderia ubonensis]|uniref:transposase n=1 Tax=Burkholderia ubonensis TaxID=101571 RepID=UPI001E51CD6B|nr:transposase [Burkholderia ubonensis]
MNEQEDGLQSRLVVNRKRDGRRKFDEVAKRELIEACLKPGVSITRTAMEHGINPNLVRTWISKYQREQGGAEMVGTARELSHETHIFLLPFPERAECLGLGEQHSKFKWNSDNQHCWQCCTDWRSTVSGCGKRVVLVQFIFYSYSDCYIADDLLINSRERRHNECRLT